MFRIAKLALFLSPPFKSDHMRNSSQKKIYSSYFSYDVAQSMENNIFEIFYSHGIYSARNRRCIVQYILNEPIHLPRKLSVSRRDNIFNTLAIKIPSSRRMPNIACRLRRHRIIASDQRISVYDMAREVVTHTFHGEQLARNQRALGRSNCATCPTGLTDGERDGIVVLGKRPMSVNRDTPTEFP